MTEQWCYVTGTWSNNDVTSRFTQCRAYYQSKHRLRLVQHGCDVNRVYRVYATKFSADEVLFSVGSVSATCWGNATFFGMRFPKNVATYKKWLQFVVDPNAVLALFCAVLHLWLGHSKSTRQNFRAFLWRRCIFKMLWRGMHESSIYCEENERFRSA